ncbi:N6-adenosine-methyltransferase subunit METTL3-like [Corticium candelabrum]|uniref:N6-adenosine-methyltransferase subunit METTL3-like n=1 Tax=Corticium candelabrum TaxID=121492 RepID=UPI002E2587B2|nr:N6-adenosine-methyltransferase subunit METTL3-like [Corticium candelabrum]
MSNLWVQLHLVKRHRDLLRDHLKVRRERRRNWSGQDFLQPKDGAAGVGAILEELAALSERVSGGQNDEEVSFGGDVEKSVWEKVVELNLTVGAPFTSSQVVEAVMSIPGLERVSSVVVCGVLRKLCAQELVILDKTVGDDLKLLSVDEKRITAIMDCSTPRSKLEEMIKESGCIVKSKKIQAQGKSKKQQLKLGRMRDGQLVNLDAYIDVLLSVPSARESENQKYGVEIIELLNTPSVKEQRMLEKFRSEGGTKVREFCTFGTKEECARQQGTRRACNKVHFRKIIGLHTDVSLGDCSFLNTCFHMETCKYIHYKIDTDDLKETKKLTKATGVAKLNTSSEGVMKMMPAQWVQCDIRTLDYSVLGKFSVVMADPPWDIHMELPYGTMSDDEMRKMAIPSLQDNGYIFLWVTGRAMELGRELLEIWGYRMVDELIWVKTNQLQRLIRTGRTGHWLNHAKEHCLIGQKGDVSNFNVGLDCDVLVAEVRDTSHKPDEIYGVIERLAPGHRKIELFGRHHNVQPNWVTLGNQLQGVHLLDPDMVVRYRERYPDGNCVKT